MTRFHFFGGKGGVGKTTLSAAYAVRRAAAGERVLLVSTDPAHSLGDLLEVKLSGEPRRLKAEGALFVAELDAKRALEKWLAERRGVLARIAERGTYLEQADLEPFLDLSLPGAEELIGLLELSRLAERGVDRVVVDTAPTGHTLRLLEMPDALAQLASLLDRMQEKHRLIAESLGGAWRADAADALIDELDGRARALAALLRDKERCAFHWVTLAEPLAVLESCDGIAALRREGIPVSEVIANRLTPRPERPCALCDARRREEARALRSLSLRFGALPMREIEARSTEPRGLKELAAWKGAHAAAQPTVRRTVQGERRREAPESNPQRSPRTLTAKSARWRSGAQPHPDPSTPALGADAQGERSFATIFPDTLELVFLGGKGGVGKTSTACAVALELARRHPERAVLLLSVDPAHSLSDALAQPVGDSPVAVRGGPKNLRARELDAKAAYAREKTRYLESVDALFDRLRGDSRFDAAQDRAIAHELLALAPPGIDELFAVLELLDALEPGAAAHPLLVIDTAPTGHALRLLELPRLAHGWVKAMLSVLLRYQGALGLGRLAEDLVRLSRSLRVLQELLADPTRAIFLPVTRLEPLPVEETRRLLAALKALTIAVPALFLNAVVAGGCRRCTRAAREGERLAARIGWRGAIIACPAQAPAPRGVEALERWRAAWKER